MSTDPSLITARDLVQWASRSDAPAQLPRLLRQLIRATVPDLTRLAFPGDESIQLPGWDGVAVTPTGSAEVPAGLSVWEASTERDVKGKADQDYVKRSESPRDVTPSEATYIAITAQRWSGKDAWADGRRAEGIWRDVRAYDAEDLVAWLEAAPAVHSWISSLIGKRPQGVRDLASAWTAWSTTTNPPISPNLVIGGRSEVAEAVHNWLQAPASAFVLQADSPDEALAFFLAVVDTLSPESRLDALSRALIVSDETAWDRLTASETPLLLLPTFENHGGVPQAIRRGHQVFLPIGREKSSFASVVELPRLARPAAETALKEMGFSEKSAREMASLARRSLMSLRRKLALVPAIQNPRWSTPSEARAILAAMLAGSWNNEKEGDREVVACLAGQPYTEYAPQLIRWAHESDPPLRQIGNVWLLISREDAWNLLSRYLSSEDLGVLEKVVLEILGEVDPALEVDSDKRYMASVLGHHSRHSGLLMKGLAETLAIMGARGESVQIGGASSASDYAGFIVRKLLDRANEDWRVWASLDRALPRLAEAAPDAFLSLVEESLGTDGSGVLRLFSEETEGIVSSVSYHTGLLWALESLAWSPEHLARTALLLARLHRLDPGGRLSNRPGNSFRSIFLLWYPQTSATADQRLRVLGTVLQREPESGFELLCNILPSGRDWSLETSKPKWREWVPDAAPLVTVREHRNSMHEITRWLAEAAGTSGTRWVQLIDKLGQLPKDTHDLVVDKLLHLPLRKISPPDRVAIWDALRALVSRHRGFADADWALPGAEVDRIAKAYKRLEPRDLILKYAWLFADSPALMRPREDQWEIHQTRVQERRSKALREVYQKLGIDGIMKLLETVARPYELGTTLGMTSILSATDEDELLRRTITEDDGHRAFVQPYLHHRFRARGWEWAEEKLHHTLSSTHGRATLLASLPYSDEVWDRVEAFGAEVERLYWTRVGNIHWIEGGGSAARPIQKLLRFGRPFTALDSLFMLNHRKLDVPGKLVVAALEQAAQTNPADDPVNIQSLGYHVGELLTKLEEVGEISEDEIARLEWLYVPLMRHESTRRPKFLHRELERNPEFFAEIVSCIYRGESDEVDSSPEASSRARVAWELLNDWHGVPGRSDAGELDEAILRDWCTKARTAVRARGRRIGDIVIGETLRYTPAGPDGAWPAIAVRNLIEDWASEDLERGLELEVYNSRGVVTKDPYSGGGAERSIAVQYRRYAELVRDQWPRTAAMLERIAATYGRDARREDTDAEFRQDFEH